MHKRIEKSNSNHIECCWKNRTQEFKTLCYVCASLKLLVMHKFGIKCRAPFFFRTLIDDYQCVCARVVSVISQCSFSLLFYLSSSGYGGGWRFFNLNFANTWSHRQNCNNAMFALWTYSSNEPFASSSKLMVQVKRTPLHHDSVYPTASTFSSSFMFCLCYKNNFLVQLVFNIHNTLTYALLWNNLCNCHHFS